MTNELNKLLTFEERLELLKEAMGEDRYNSAIEDLVPFGGGMSEYYDIYKIPKYISELTNHDTWGNNIPMIYLDKDGWMVKRWNDGTIEKMEKII